MNLFNFGLKLSFIVYSQQQHRIRELQANCSDLKPHTRLRHKTYRYIKDVY